MAELKSPSGEDSKKLEISLKHVSRAAALLASPLRGEVKERIRSDPNLLLETNEHKGTASNNTMDSDSFHSSLLQSTLDEEEDAPIGSVVNLKDSKTDLNDTVKHGNSKSFGSNSSKEIKKVLPPYIISKVETAQSTLKSGLSLLLQRKADLNNPLAEQYAKFVKHNLPLVCKTRCKGY